MLLEMVVTIFGGLTTAQLEQLASGSNDCNKFTESIKFLHRKLKERKVDLNEV